MRNGFEKESAKVKGNQVEILDNAVAVWAERSPEVPLGNWEGGENDETRSQKTCFDCISVLRVTAKEMCRKRAIQELRNSC